MARSYKLYYIRLNRWILCDKVVDVFRRFDVKGIGVNLVGHRLRFKIGETTELIAPPAQKEKNLFQIKSKC